MHTTPDTREPHELPTMSSVGIHRIDPDHDVAVRVGDTWVTADIGHRATAMVEVFGDGDTTDDQLANLAEIGRAITAQAEQQLRQLRYWERKQPTDRASYEDYMCAHCIIANNR